MQTRRVLEDRHGVVSEAATLISGLSSLRARAPRAICSRSLVHGGGPPARHRHQHHRPLPGRNARKHRRPERQSHGRTGHAVTGAMRWHNPTNRKPRAALLPSVCSRLRQRASAVTVSPAAIREATPERADGSGSCLAIVETTVVSSPVVLFLPGRCSVSSVELCCCSRCWCSH